jgi:hypothetical protein
LGGKMSCYTPNGQLDEGWQLEVDVLQPFLQVGAFLVAVAVAGQ